MQYRRGLEALLALFLVKTGISARFAARFADFSAAPETVQVMRERVAHGEADHRVAERVWQQLARGLMRASRRACLRCCASAREDLTLNFLSGGRDHAIAVHVQRDDRDVLRAGLIQREPAALPAVLARPRVAWSAR